MMPFRSSHSKPLAGIDILVVGQRRNYGSNTVANCFSCLVVRPAPQYQYIGLDNRPLKGYPYGKDGQVRPISQQIVRCRWLIGNADINNN